MPELPEVEVVRRGLDAHVTGRTIERVELFGARVARRHEPGPEHLSAVVAGREVIAARRRGKYLWLVLRAPHPAAAGLADEVALMAHLGMSGQLLVEPADAPDERHLHARFTFADAGAGSGGGADAGGVQLRFVDQRTFGGLALSELGPSGVPGAIAHIAPDPFDPEYDEGLVVRRLKARRSAIKRALLDQSLVSGIGNIYADEALWRAQVHGERLAGDLTKPTLARVLSAAREVMAEALEEGGTSFDRLYVNVNGASGYFDRSLAAYGQVGRPCQRCGTPIAREHFMNRSSFFCPNCQRRPRTKV